VVVPDEVAHGAANGQNDDVCDQRENDLIRVPFETRLLGLWMVVGVHADLTLLT